MQSMVVYTIEAVQTVITDDPLPHTTTLMEQGMATPLQTLQSHKSGSTCVDTLTRKKTETIKTMNDNIFIKIVLIVAWVYFSIHIVMGLMEKTA